MVQRPKQAQNKLAAAQTKIERSMLNITYKYRKTNIWVRERTKVIDIINTKKNEMVMGRAYQPPQRRLTDGPCVSLVGDHMTRKDDKGDQPSGGRPGQILERHDMAEDSTRQSNLETAC